MINKQTFKLMCLLVIGGSCDPEPPAKLAGTFYYQPQEKLFTVEVKDLGSNRYAVKGIGNDAVFMREKDTLIFKDKNQHVKLIYNKKAGNYMVYISGSKVGRIYPHAPDVISFEKQNSLKSIGDSWNKKMNSP